MAYSLFDQKQITAWLDLRNNVAHGHYSRCSPDEVGRLIEWVRDFIGKNQRRSPPLQSGYCTAAMQRYLSSSFLPTFKLSKFRIALKTRK